MNLGNLIVFIYDVEAVLEEEDDPADAIAYFYPSSICIEQQLWLCGTLITMQRGMTRLVGSCPEILKFVKMKFTFNQDSKYVIVLGVPSIKFSDSSVKKMCQQLLEIWLFYHPSINSMVLHQHKGVIEMLVKEVFPDWVNTEFGTIPFFNSSRHELGMKLTQPTALKHMSILDSCCRYTAVLASCLLMQKSVLCSLMSPDVTKYCVIASNCDSLGEKVDLGGNLHCRFIPVFITKDQYDKIVRKQLQRYDGSDWMPSKPDSPVRLKNSSSETQEKMEKHIVVGSNAMSGITESSNYQKKQIKDSCTSSDRHRTESKDMNVSGPSVGAHIQRDPSCDTASITSDSQANDSSSDEVFDEETDVLDIKTLGHNLQEGPKSSSGTSFGEDGYFSAQNDLCRFLYGNVPSEANDSERDKCNDKTGSEENTKINENASKQTTEQHAMPNGASSSSADQSSFDTCGAERKPLMDASPYSAIRELLLFVCTDYNISLVVLIQRNSDRRNKMLVEAIMNDCLQDFRASSRWLPKYKELTRTERMQNDKTESLQCSNSTGRIAVNLSTNGREKFRNSVTNLQNTLNEISSLKRIVLQDASSTFHGDRIFHQTRYFYSQHHETSHI